MLNGLSIVIVVCMATVAMVGWKQYFPIFTNCISTFSRFGKKQIYIWNFSCFITIKTETHSIYLYFLLFAGRRRRTDRSIRMAAQSILWIYQKSRLHVQRRLFNMYDATDAKCTSCATAAAVYAQFDNDGHDEVHRHAHALLTVLNTWGHVTVPWLSSGWHTVMNGVGGEGDGASSFLPLRFKGPNFAVSHYNDLAKT